jgi:hypothetical protein
VVRVSITYADDDGSALAMMDTDDMPSAIDRLVEAFVVIGPEIITSVEVRTHDREDACSR